MKLGDVVAIVVLLAMLECGVVGVMCHWLAERQQEAHDVTLAEMAAMEERLNKRLDAIDAEFDKSAWWEIRRDEEAGK